MQEPVLRGKKVDSSRVEYNRKLCLRYKKRPLASLRGKFCSSEPKKVVQWLVWHCASRQSVITQVSGEVMSICRFFSASTLSSKWCPSPSLLHKSSAHLSLFSLGSTTIPVYSDPVRSRERGYQNCPRGSSVSVYQS